MRGRPPSVPPVRAGNGPVSGASGTVATRLAEAGAADLHPAGRSWWRRAFVAAIGATILAVAAWALLGSSLLVVRHVLVTGNGSLVPAAAVRSAAAIRPGTPLARVDGAVVARRVERLAPVASAQVRRSFPDTVVITVVLRTPALAVRMTGGYALVDADGVTVTVTARQPAGIPRMTSPPAVLRGSPAVRVAALVIRSLPGPLAERVRLVAASASSVTLRLAGGITVVWGGPGHAAQKAAELDVLLRRTHAHYVDLSDPNAVVTQR